MPAIGHIPLLKRIDIVVPKLEDDLNSLVLQVLSEAVKTGNIYELWELLFTSSTVTLKSL